MHDSETQVAATGSIALIPPLYSDLRKFLIHVKCCLLKIFLGVIMGKPAIIECPSCEHKVSTTATSCPSCGAVLRKPKRGIFGKIVLFLFWGFNALMLLWIWGGTKSATESSAGLSGAEAAGAAIGTGIGVTILVFIWLIGAVILGIMALLTRPK